MLRPYSSNPWRHHVIYISYIQMFIYYFQNNDYVRIDIRFRFEILHKYK